MSEEKKQEEEEKKNTDELNVALLFAAKSTYLFPILFM